jgi:hypothetical protein
MIGWMVAELQAAALEVSEVETTYVETIGQGLK